MNRSSTSAASILHSGLIVVVFLLGLIPYVASSQSRQLNVRLVRSVKPQTVEIIHLNGFVKKISGITIPYHSSHPDANDALIARTRSDMRRIEWETDTIRTASLDGLYRFIWIAGIDRAGFGLQRPERTFTFGVEGTTWFTFQNRKDSSAFHWRKENVNGASLSFSADLSDQYGDLFGNMILTVPASLCTIGKSLRLFVEGENADVPDWYMTMQYAFNFVPGVRLEPVLVRSGRGPQQLLRIGVDNLEIGNALVTEIDGKIDTHSLRLGANTIFVKIDQVREQTDLLVMVEQSDRRMISLHPIPMRDVYLLPYSHNDIGYSDPQPVVLQKQRRYLEQALELIRKTSDYPEEARFKWNVEILWPFTSYLDEVSDEKRNAILHAVKSGSIGLNAFTAGVLTGLAQSVEMSRFFDDAQYLRKRFGLTIETAVITDVPGHTWGIVPALAHAGVKYFAMAPNAFDRIGYAYEVWGDKPFRWESQSGEESVLAWMAGSSYSAFHEGTLAKLGDEKMFALLRGFDQRKVTSSILQLPYTIGGDNGPPDSTLPDLVRRWNETYASPRLIIATHGQMFKAYEALYRDSVRTVRGDFTPYWEDGAASSAYELAEGRKAVDRLVRTEALWSMRSPGTFPDSMFRSAWRNVTLWDEHTWGASNSISEPDSPSVKAQWEFKRQYVLEAKRESEALESAIVPPGLATRFVDVINTLNWPRTDVVILSAELNKGFTGVETSDGCPVDAQRLSTGELAFRAEHVPALGVQRYKLVARAGTITRKATAEGFSLENEFISVRVDPKSGAIVSVMRKQDGYEFVDSARGGLNRYLYVPGRDPLLAQVLANASVRILEHGDLIAQLEITGDAPGCRSYTTTIRLVAGIERIDIVNRIDKLPIREREGVHFAFPFRVGGAQPRYDVASSIVRTEIDQLPGSCKNLFTAQNWVDVSNDSLGISTALISAPMFQVGAITVERPWMKTIQPSSSIYSYVMNNYWHTNYKADQEGPAEFKYQLRPHGRFDELEAVRFGLADREPLIVASADAKIDKRQLPFELRTEAVLLSIVPREKGNAFSLFVYNPTSSVQSLSCPSRVKSRVLLYDSDPTGNALRGPSSLVEISPHGTKYLLVRMNEAISGQR